MMNQEFKKKWIEALRSNDYLQGKGYLCKDNKYCCLGVACIIDGLPAINDPDIENIKAFEDQIMIPYYERYNSWGLKFTNIDILTNMNDNNASFIEIADWIEENL